MTSAISMSSYSSYASTQTRAADTSKLQQQQLFSKVDTNGDKPIDQTELKTQLMSSQMEMGHDASPVSGLATQPSN